MQRTYINAFPIDQVAYDKDANNDMKLTIAEQHETSRHTWAGFPYTWYPKFTFDDTEEQRQAFWEDLWKKGGFQFWIGNYQDVAMNQKANDEAYAFWRKKVHARVNDKTTAEKLAPLTPIYPMCTKRPCLENKFYEVFNQDNVDLVNLRENGIQEFTEDGVIFEDGSKAEFDILVKATGFDSITGGITSIDIRGTDANISIKEKWSKGVRTYLGQTSAGFPNLFWIYGPQAPTAFVNGPTGAEAQSDWMVHTFAFMRRQGYSTIEATPEAEAAWRKEVVDYGAASLFAKSGGWYYGANIPGKPQESLNYLEGMPKFKKRCWDAIANNYEGFELGK
jgi:cyclohexanone monooxygenase